MKRLAIFACILFAAASAGHAAAPSPPHYELVKTVALGPPDGWDFVHFDPAQNRVYVSHESEVTVVDGKTGALIGRVKGIAGAHDIAIVPELGRGYADNGQTGEVTVFDLASLRPLAKIPADKDADAMMYDPATRRLVVGSGDARDASIIDVAAGKRIAVVPLGGTAESMVSDATGNAFINVDTANEVVRLNFRTNGIDARWATPGCEAPHGLAIDTSSHRLFASCRNAKMIVLDADSGKPLALLPIGVGTDSAAFDPVRKLAFSANKNGTLSIVAEQGPAQFASLGDLPTAPGARNMALDPGTGRIFLVTADVIAQHPPRTTGGAPDYVFAPGSVKLIILDPAR
jgi:DNA-binding beta-propeller fold protein YncE